MTMQEVGKEWGVRLKTVVLCIFFASVMNMIYSWRMTATVIMPWEAWPALVFIGIVVLFASLVCDLVKKVFKNGLPVLFFVALTVAILSFSFTGVIAQFIASTFAKVNISPVFTACAVYTGMAAGQSVGALKKDGLGIVVVHIVGLLGTYFGSAIIAQLVMSAMGVI